MTLSLGQTRLNAGIRPHEESGLPLALSPHPGIRPMALVFGLALAIRLGYLAFTGMDPTCWLAPDSVIYRGIAQGILETGDFVRIGDINNVIVETERVPVYALFLVPFLALFGGSVLAPLVGQAAVGAVTCVLIGLLARELEERAFLPAGLLAAACLNMIAHGAMILTESVFLFFLTLHLWTAARFLRQSRMSSAALSGIWLGIAVMTRTVAMYWLPIYAIFVALFLLHRKKSARIAAIYAVVVFFSGALVILPQYVRNYSQFGHWQLTSQNGTNILHWYVPLVMEFSSGIPWSKGVAIMNEALRSEMEARGFKEPPANPFASSNLESEVGRREFFRLGTGAVLHGWTAGAAINLLTPSMASVGMVERMERPRFYQTQGSNFADKTMNFLFHPKNRLYLILMLPGILLTLVLRAVLIFGVWHSLKRPAIFSAAVLLLLSLAYFLAVTGPLVNAARYRIPMEPAIIVFAAVGLGCIRDWWHRKRNA